MLKGYGPGDGGGYIGDSQVYSGDIGWLTGDHSGYVGDIGI